ncbi:MAG: hypothetical protein HC835_17055 [Oscillatoriales cyanobacterium RM2_1_1]|nr:hypothetical protein [Oscillatoriales cyanobacterium SM2_3_0]NJO47182.1 hypothetical protein [Oscillatoriales cyanobacterium RM2_1_1]
MTAFHWALALVFTGEWIWDNLWQIEVKLEPILNRTWQFQKAGLTTLL